MKFSTSVKRLILCLVLIVVSIILFACSSSHGTATPGDVIIYSDVVSGQSDLAEYKSSIYSLKISDDDSDVEKNISVTYDGVSYNVIYDDTVKPIYSLKSFDEYRFPEQSSSGLRIDRESKAVVGVYRSISDRYRDYVSDEALVAAGKAELAKITDISYYKQYKLEKNNDSNWLYLYNELDGIRLGDYACVAMLNDGTVTVSYAMPDKRINISNIKEFDSSAFTTAAESKVTEKYSSSKYTELYKSFNRNLMEKFISVNEKEELVVVYYYLIEFEPKDEATDLSQYEFVYITVDIVLK